MRLSREITEEPHTTENKVCAGFTMRDSALLQQLPCNTGAPTEALQDCGCSTEKRKNRKRRKVKLAPDCRGALARCVAMERQRNPEKPIAKTGCAQV